VRKDGRVSRLLELLGPQLARLQRELKEDTYNLAGRQHPIPKRDKPGEYRMLGYTCDL